MGEPLFNYALYVRTGILCLWLDTCAALYGAASRHQRASDLLVNVLGKRGKHARAAIGMVALPLGIAVGIGTVAEVRD